MTVGPYAAGETPVGTETVYDGLGRVAQVRRWANAAITVEDVENGGAVVARAATQWTKGDLLSTSRTEYDVAGRVWRVYSQTEAGEGGGADEVCTQEYEYDLAGRQVKVTALSDDAANKSTTVTEYLGPFRSAVIDAAGNRTSFEYDSLGRVVTTIHPASVVEGAGASPVTTYTHVGYDGLGRKAWESAQTVQENAAHVDAFTEPSHLKLRKREYMYDAAGRLA